MGFLKKMIVSCSAIFLIFFSGTGVKSDSIFMQAGAFIGLVIGLIILYVFVKMAWRAMGCLPALLIIIALSFFVMYAIGAFSGGLDKIDDNIREFLGQNIKTSEDILEEEKAEEDVKEETKNKEEPETGIVNLIEEDKHKIFTEDLKDKLLPKAKTVTKTSQFNPMKYPAINGATRVLSGDTLVMGEYIIKLYGIAAPDIKQTCAARDGRGYRCGQQSAIWLSEWLTDHEVECHVVQNTGQYLLSVCLLGAYDIGAAIVNAGWAVADTRISPIYQPYQDQAINNKRGIWDGKFYMPWDWQKIQNRKANIQIIHRSKNSDRKLFSFF